MIDRIENRIDEDGENGEWSESIYFFSSYFTIRNNCVQCDRGRISGIDYLNETSCTNLPF